MKDAIKKVLVWTGWMTVAVWLVLGLVYAAYAQGPVASSETIKFQTAEGTGLEKADQKAKKPSTPKEVTIPEARQDKVKILQKEAEIVELKQRDLYNRALQQLQASPEWKALEAEATETGRKFSVELQSALRLAGVDEKDFGKYSYSKDTLTFTLAPPKAEGKKE